MSMWELEAFAERNVLMVDASDLSLTEKRNAYANIYALVGDFDVSFIHFRTVDALIRASFFHRIEITQHPDYADHRAYFDKMVAKGDSEWINARQGNSDDDLSFDSLYEPKPHESSIKPGLWFDSTMPLWPRAVEAGLLTGLAADPVEMWSRKETIVRLLKLGARQGDAQHGVLKMLHGVVAYSLCQGDDVPKAGDAALATVRDLPELKAALASPQEDWIDDRFDARKALRHMDADTRQFLEWWCAAYPD